MKSRSTDEEPTVTLAFQGLMFFQTDRLPQQVVVVDGREHGHEGTIEVWRSEDGTGTGKLKLKIDKEIKNDDVISFDFAGSGVVRSSTLYTDHVPPLRNYLPAGDIADDVIHQLTHPGALAYVNLPPGELTTWDAVGHRVALINKNTRSEDLWCFARFVLLQTETTFENLIIYHREAGTTEKIEIKPYDLIAFSNIADHVSLEHHFALYENILTPRRTLSAVFDTPSSCPFQSSNDLTEQVEDALKLIKRARDAGHSPGADCGPTGP